MYDPDDPYVEIRPKIWQKNTIDIAGADRLYVLPSSNRSLERNNKIAVIRNNIVYLVDYLTH